MPWKLIEVPDDDEHTLSDRELLGIENALEVAEGIGIPDGPSWIPFSAIRRKIRMYFGKAIMNEVSK